MEVGINLRELRNNIYMRDEVIEINGLMKSSPSTLMDPLSSAELSKFKIEDVDFCVNPEPEKAKSIRRDVRIVAGARNASGVEMIAQDDETEVCNRCE